ncbi:MAG: hypothetical protein WBD99_16340 [Thermodesulfobacteriota bacterium]
MSERPKNLDSPGEFILLKIDHLDIAIQNKIEALQEVIERIEPGMNVELDIKLTLISETKKPYRICEGNNGVPDELDS